MDKFDIVISREAQNDLLDIADRLLEISVEVANKTIDKLIEDIQTLKTFPRRCPYSRNSILRLKGYRWLGSGNYLIFYVVADSTVQIRRVLYAKSDYMKVI